MPNPPTRGGAERTAPSGAVWLVNDWLDRERRTVHTHDGRFLAARAVVDGVPQYSFARRADRLRRRDKHHLMRLLTEDTHHD